MNVLTLPDELWVRQPLEALCEDIPTDVQDALQAAAQVVHGLVQRPYLAALSTQFWKLVPTVSNHVATAGNLAVTPSARPMNPPVSFSTPGLSPSINPATLLIILSMPARPLSDVKALTMPCASSPKPVGYLWQGTFQCREDLAKVGEHGCEHVLELGGHGLFEMRQRLREDLRRLT